MVKFTVFCISFLVLLSSRESLTQNGQPVNNEASLNSTEDALAWFNISDPKYYLPCNDTEIVIEIGNCNCTLEPARLLILLVDGFRWDYYEMHKEKLPGLTNFLSQGARAEYVEPIFPANSLPSWRSLMTGLYPESHNILNNFMFRRAANPETVDRSFDFWGESSMESDWWQDAEPLWITATKQGHRVFLSKFSRCDVPYQNVTPEVCTGYHDGEASNNITLQEQLRKAVEHFNDGFTLALVYYPDVDIVAHQYGPNSAQVLDALVVLDKAVQAYLNTLNKYGLDQIVSTVINGDHGCTDVSSTSDIKYVSIKDYLGETIRGVYKLVEYGSFTMIFTWPQESEMVYNKLAGMLGMDVYRKEEIPDELHFREGRYVGDILVVMQPGYYLMGLCSQMQLPGDWWKACSPYVYGGIHGYYNNSDMRTVFYARGPAFANTGDVKPGIRLEDQYQIFTSVLGIEPKGHNGSWDRVTPLLNATYPRHTLTMVLHDNDEHLH